MYTSIESYLKRISSVLDKTIAPAIESDHARGQVYAVINLLDQLGARVEIKQEIIDREIELGVKVLTEVAASMDRAGVKVEGDPAALLDELRTKGPVMEPASCEKLDQAISSLIDLFFDHRDTMKAEDATAVDQTIRDYLTKLATRDIGLAKPPNFDQISRSKKE